MFISGLLCTQVKVVLVSPRRVMNTLKMLAILEPHSKHFGNYLQRHTLYNLHFNCPVAPKRYYDSPHFTNVLRQESNYLPGPTEELWLSELRPAWL